MGMQKMELVSLLVMICLCAVSISMAAVCKVGGSAGWTLSQNIDYHAWATHRKFYLGDILVFEYSPSYHNVLIVSDGDFESCNSTFPLQTYNSGNDSITLKKPGQLFFICGFPGHCQAGQKFNVHVDVPTA